MVFSDLFTCQRTRQLLSRRNRKEREILSYRPNIDRVETRQLLEPSFWWS
jgi:hypothetical protein